MDMSKINSRWTRPIRDVSRKRRKTGLMNYAKRKNKKFISKVEPEDSSTASGLNLFQELNLEDKPAYNNDANSIEINCGVTKPINVNEGIANRTIVKEEIDIKEEVCDHLTFDTTESNVTPDFSLSESNPCSNNAHSNLITEELDTNQVINLIPNDNIRIGIDESLNGGHVKGIFSSETIGSKTLIVFRRLPGEQESTVPKVVNEKGSECSDRKKAVKLRVQDDRKKAILKGKYTKVCSKCEIPSESDSVRFSYCTMCGAHHLFSCKQCSQTFESYSILSHHILVRCAPQGYYYCPQCDYKSRCFYVVRKHVLALHPHLGSDFDLRSIEWKDIAKDEDGVTLSMHICPKCGRAFQRLSYYNNHAGVCRKIRPGFKSISANDDSGTREDENSSTQENDRKKKIVLHCEKCNKDTKFYRYLNCQPNCIDCQSKLKFRCNLCNNLMDRDAMAARHLQSTCDPQQKLKCRFCEKTFQYEHNLLKHEKRHLKISKRQVESPSKEKSLEQAEKFPDNSKNEIHSSKSTLSTCEKEKMSSNCFSRQKSDAKFAKTPDLTRQSIESRRQSHSKISKRQVESSSLKKKSLDQAENFPDNGKNEIDSNKSTLSTCEKEKMSSKCFSRQKSNAKFAKPPDLTRQSKYSDKKLQMQCKVLLTRLSIDES